MSSTYTVLMHSIMEPNLLILQLGLSNQVTSFEPILGIITKTCLYSFDPLKPHFYIVKLGFTGVYIIFLILLEHIDCGYSLEPPRRGGSNEYKNLCFEQKYEKYLNFCLKIFNFSVINYPVYLNRHVFVMI